MNVSLGYSVPEEISEIGKDSIVHECFQRAEFLHSELITVGLTREAHYAPLFNHFIRWNMGMNVRELGHLTELRSQKAGHPKYRRTVQMMAKLDLQRHPEMGQVLRFIEHETSCSRRPTRITIKHGDDHGHVGATNRHNHMNPEQ